MRPIQPPLLCARFQAVELLVARNPKPTVRLPTARAHGVRDLEIVVDAHERYPYRFAAQQARTVRRRLPAADAQRRRA
jgi:hypothetical protein